MRLRYQQTGSWVGGDGGLKCLEVLFIKLLGLGAFLDRSVFFFTK